MRHEQITVDANYGPVSKTLPPIRSYQTPKALFSPGFYKFFFSAQLFLTMYLICVHISYIAAASTENYYTFGDSAFAAANGDSGRQLTYLSIAAISILVSASRRRVTNWSAISQSYLLACSWALLSAIWAIDPIISIRRSVGMVVVLWPLASAIENLGAKQTLKVIYIFVTGCIFASYVSVTLHNNPLFSFSIHPSDEVDPKLIGAWRGIFRHKNVAGAVMAHSANIYFFHFITRRRFIDIVMMALAIFFLYKTNSWTSTGLVGTGILFGLIHSFLFRKNYAYAARYIAGIFATIFVIAIPVLVFEGEKIAAFIKDPTSISGRMAIWQTLAPYIAEHPWLGSGYGSFYGIGAKSPMFKLAHTNFIYGVGHSHSGYFEVLVTTGTVGLVLAVSALIVMPVYRMMHVSKEDVWLGSLCFSLWSFGILQNFTESMFFAPDKESWSFVVVAITLLHTRHVARMKNKLDWLKETAWLPKVTSKKFIRRHNHLNQESALRINYRQSSGQ